MRADEGELVRFAVRPSTVVLVALGVTLVVLGVWVEDRSAVAAPLVVLGAVIAALGVVMQGWADTIEEVSMSQSGFTLRRQVPSAEDLAKAGVPPEAAGEIERWMSGLIDALPGVVDARVRRVLAEQAESQRQRQKLVRLFMDRQRGADQGDEELGPR